MTPLCIGKKSPILTRVWEKMTYVQERMKEYGDPSHDWRHILRVSCIALRSSRCKEDPELHDMVGQVALLHDMFDKKFLKTKEAIDQRRKEILSLLLQEPMAEQIIEVAERISWSDYVARGKPTFQGPLAERMLLCWEIVSAADWMDAQLVIRARDYALRKEPGISESMLKERVKVHWDEKMCRLHEHAMDSTIKELMIVQYHEQKQVLEYWLAK